MELSDKQLRRMSDNAQKPRPDERLASTPAGRPKPDEKIPVFNTPKSWHLQEVERIIAEEEMLRESAEIDRHTYEAKQNL